MPLPVSTKGTDMLRTQRGDAEGRHDLGVDAHAEGVAEQLLANFWFVEPNGLTKLPVDPIAIARKLGLDVFYSALDPDVAGILVKQRGDTPQIHLNASDPRVRQRFTCGHEIGHYMRRQGGSDFGYVDRRSALSSQGTDPEERFANGVAAALLMPAKMVRERRAFGAPKLAADFNVSLEAMKHRLSNL